MKYYIIDEKGNSIFELPYDFDFCIHCLLLLLNRDIDTSKYRLLSSCGVFYSSERLTPFLVCSFV